METGNGNWNWKWEQKYTNHWLMYSTHQWLHDCNLVWFSLQYSLLIAYIILSRWRVLKQCGSWEVVKPGTMEMEMKVETETEMEMEMLTRHSHLQCCSPRKLQSPLNSATILYK